MKKYNYYYRAVQLKVKQEFFEAMEKCRGKVLSQLGLSKMSMTDFLTYAVYSLLVKHGCEPKKIKNEKKD